MEQLIVDMMSWANVSEKELYERKELPTDFGETLSWEYLCFVRANPINWKMPTEILYAEHDNLDVYKRQLPYYLEVTSCPYQTRLSVAVSKFRNEI